MLLLCPNAARVMHKIAHVSCQYQVLVPRTVRTWYDTRRHCIIIVLVVRAHVRRCCPVWLLLVLPIACQQQVLVPRIIHLITDFITVLVVCNVVLVLQIDARQEREGATTTYQVLHENLVDSSGKKRKTDL